jgi:hypothetical protein
MLYFHGNAEDLGYANEFLVNLKNELKVNILAVEYPGYGLYNQFETSADKILEDSEIVFDYLTKTLGIKSENIFVFGRSIGSGPATHLCAKKNPGNSNKINDKFNYFDKKKNRRSYLNVSFHVNS